MIVARDNQVVPNAGALDFTPQQQPAPGLGDVITSAFRQNNPVASFLSQHWADNTRDADHNPWLEIQGTEFEPYYQRFLGSFNAGQTAALKQQITMEQRDRQVLDASGGLGMITSMGAAVLSPEILLPGGSIYRGVKSGQAILRTGLSTAGATALSTSMAEFGLMSTQVTRTPQEAALNIGMSTLLGGILGGSISGLFNGADWLRLAKGMDAEAIAASDMRLLQENENAVLGIARPSDAGAAARPVPTLEQNSIAGRAATVVGAATAQLNPVLRALHSASPVYRDIATRLFESPIYMKAHLAGETSGPAAESLVKQYQGNLASALEQANSIYGEFRKAGGQLNRSEFNQAVGRAMRRADQDENPAVAKAAQAWRSTVFEPLKDEAIKLGMLPEDVSVSTAASYFSRRYNRLLIEAQEQEFKSIVSGWLDGQVRNLEMKRDEIGIGNLIVQADMAGERFARAAERLEGADARVNERGAIRGRKVSELNDIERRMHMAQGARPPASLVSALRSADENANMLAHVKDARAAERSNRAKKPMADRLPVLHMIKRKGGVRVGSPLDQHLRAMGVTPKTQPGLFRTSGGLNDLDNLPWDEEELFQMLPQAPDGWYVDQQSLIDAIRAEVAGNPLRTADQLAAEADADAVADWASRWLGQLGLPASTTVGDARRYISEITSAEREADALISRTNRLEKNLVDFDNATDRILNERAIAQEEMDAAAKEMNDLNEAILNVQEIASASPRVSIIVDYAKAKRDAFRKRLDQKRLKGRAEALKRIEARGQANPSLLDDLYSTNEKLTAVNSDVTRLDAKIEKLKPMVPRMRQEMPDFLSEADRAEYIDGIAADIFNKVTGRDVDIDLPRDIVVADRGPLARRTFNIPDHLIERFLEDDVEMVARGYARVMGADVELTRQFGRADMKDQVEQVKLDYAKLRAAVAAGVDAETGAPLTKPLTAAQREAEIKKLSNRERQDLTDLKALRDMLRGTYLADRQGTLPARAMRTMGAFNYMRSLGGVTLSSVTDVGRHAMVHGFDGLFRDGLVPMMRNLKGFKMAASEAKLAGTVTERLLNTRLATMAELTDPYSSRSPFEAFVDNAATMFSKLTLLDHWTDMNKALASNLTQNRILRGSGKYASLPKRERDYLAFLGIDGSMAERIAREFDAHGFEDGGVRVAGTEEWADDWARRVFRAAVAKDVDSTIVTKGIGDVPLWMNTPTGKLVGQFKSFAASSHQRVLMRGLQERPTAVLSGVVFSMLAGMLVYALKSIESNRMDDLSDNPGRWMMEGIDRSGILSVAMEINNTVERSLGVGAYGAFAALFPGADQDGKSSRYTMRSEAAALLGPSADLIDTAVRAVWAIKGSGDGMTEADVNSIRRLLPYSTLPGIRSLIEYAGMPSVTGR